MAYRPGPYIVQDRIDNTSPKSISGHLLLRGEDQPVHLELTGDCMPDLRGCTVRFEPGEIAKEQLERREGTEEEELPTFTEEGFAFRQVGTTGAITADCWIKVPEVPVEEAMKGDGPPGDFPFEWHRRFYMEWYSQNGRVVLELPDPRLAFLEGEDNWDPDENPPPDQDAESQLNPTGPTIFTVKPDSIEEVDTERNSSGDPEENAPLHDEDLDKYIRRLVGNPDRTAFLNEPEDSMEETRMMDYLIEEGEGKPFCTLLEEPDRLPEPDRLSEDAARRLVKAMLVEMAFHNVCVHICKHYSYHDTYRLMVEELLTEQFYYSQLQGTGWTTNYMTAEFCEKCQQEVQEEFEEISDAGSDNEELISGARQQLERELNRLESLFDHTPEEPDPVHDKRSGVERILLLVPVTLRRLDEDLLAGNIRPADDLHKDCVLTGLHLLSHGFEGMYLFYDRDPLSPAIETFEQALSLEEELRDLTAARDRPGRIVDDVLRTVPEFRIFYSIMENLKANRRRTPEHPPEDSRDDPVAWYEFFEEKMMLEDALIRIPEVEGFSEEAMQEAWEAYEQQSDRIKEEVIRLVESHKRSRLRERYFSRENPEAFLAVDDLPDPDDADENERAGSSASSPFAGFPSPDPPSEFLHSLPKLTAWGQSRHPSNSNSGSSDESSGWKQFPAVNDSIEQNVREYFEFVSDQLTEDRESWPPVYHYIHLLSMKPRVHIAASHAFVEDSTLNPAPVYGAYLHAIHCLRRIREAIDTLGRTELATIRNRTTDVIRDIERELD